MVEYSKMKCARLVPKLKIKLTVKLIIALLVLLIAVPIVGVGCQEEEKELPAPLPLGYLSSALVPNTPLDIFIYARQDSPTVIPADMFGMPYDINIETLAVWGVATEDEFAFGMGLTLTDAGDASRLHELDLGEEVWRMLSGSTIYLVQGSGTAAQALKTAISNNDFKPYDDSNSLKAVAALPDEGATKLTAVALVTPNQALMGLLTESVDAQQLDIINLVLKLANIDVMAGGLYSTRQIDAADIVRAMESDDGIYNLDVGLLILVQSGLPGLIVEPAVKKLLTEQEFVETNLGELTLYKRPWNDGGSVSIPMLVRIEGNQIFVAVAVKESYAEILITSVRVQQ